MNISGISEISEEKVDKNETFYCRYERDVCSYLKFYAKFFLMGEGNKESVRLYNSMKIYWGINSKVEKDFQNSETLFCKLFTAWGGMCSLI